MTARAARISSVAAVLLTAACTNYYEIPIETPIRAKLDVGAFQRVLVAGFIAGGSEDVDGNLETTRLLRSQLRTKSELRVIDADVLPLREVAAEGRDTGANGAGDAGLPGDIKDARDLDAYEHVFANVEYWKRIGEEYQQPLIVTGTVLFTNTQQAGFVNTNREVIDQLGRRVVQPMRVYMERRGFIIEPRFIFIDGRTGAVLASDRFHEEVLYPAQQNTPALSSFFELMDRLLPSFLGSFGSERIRGTRVLLK